MAKTNNIEKLVNGDVADGEVLNQIIENAGNEGGAVPYNNATQNRANGTESLGQVAYPWGNFNMNRESLVQEINTTTGTVASSIALKLLRTFINQKDTPPTYVGQALKVPRVKTDESELEFASVITEYVDGTEIECTVNEIYGFRTSSSYVKAFEFPPIFRAGTITIKWFMSASSDNNPVKQAKSKVYINDITYGSEKTQNSNGSAFFTETSIDVIEGDVISIYYKSVNSAGAAVGLGQILCANPIALPMSTDRTTYQLVTVAGIPDSSQNSASAPFGLDWDAGIGQICSSSVDGKTYKKTASGASNWTVIT